MLEKLRQMEENYLAMQKRMVDPDVISDNQQYAQLMREYKHMEPIMEKYHAYLRTQQNFTEAKDRPGATGNGTGRTGKQQRRTGTAEK